MAGMGRVRWGGGDTSMDVLPHHNDSCKKTGSDTRVSYLSIFLSFYLSFYPSIHPSINPSLRLSTYRLPYLSINLSVCLCLSRPHITVMVD